MIAPMSWPEYVALKAVNWSTLKAMRTSPLHYRHALDHPRTDTAALAAGRAAHTAILEPDRFLLDYTFWDGGRRAGKDWESFKEMSGDRAILNADEYAQALAVRDAVLANKDAARLLKAGLAEQAVTWEDPNTGLPCKARTDWLATKRGKPFAYVDLKTSRDISPRKFGNAAADFGYHCQLAHGINGLVANGWPEATPVLLIVVESAPPHDVAVLEVDEDALWAGDETVMALLRRVQECEVAKKWPGQYPTQTKLALPGWAFPAYEETVSGVVAAGGDQ